MSEAVIRAALEGRLAAWSAAQGIAVAFENVAFTPVVGTPYARAFMLPGAVSSADISRANRRHEGIFQVSLVFPQGAGAGALEAAYTTLEAQFQPQTPIISGVLAIWFTQPMRLGPQIDEPGLYVRPASVAYVLDRY